MASPGRSVFIRVSFVNGHLRLHLRDANEGSDQERGIRQQMNALPRPGHNSKVHVHVQGHGRRRERGNAPGSPDEQIAKDISYDDITNGAERNLHFNIDCAYPRQLVTVSHTIAGRVPKFNQEDNSERVTVLTVETNVDELLTPPLPDVTGALQMEVDVLKQDVHYLKSEVSALKQVHRGQATMDNTDNRVHGAE